MLLSGKEDESVKIFNSPPLTHAVVVSASIPLIKCRDRVINTEHIISNSVELRCLPACLVRLVGLRGGLLRLLMTVESRHLLMM